MIDPLPAKLRKGHPMAPPYEANMDIVATEALMQRLLSLSDDMYMKWGTDYKSFGSEETVNGLFGWGDPLSDAIRTRYLDSECRRRGLETVKQQTAYVGMSFNLVAVDGLAAVRRYQEAEAATEGGFR